MSYCTRDDILKEINHDRLSQLTSEQEGVIDWSVVDQKIAQASTDIDPYIAGKPQPANIVSLCVALSVYKIYKNRPSTIPDSVVDDKNDAITFLEKYAAGKIPSGIESAASGSAQVSANERIFTKDTMNGF